MTAGAAAGALIDATATLVVSSEPAASPRAAPYSRLTPAARRPARPAAAKALEVMAFLSLPPPDGGQFRAGAEMARWRMRQPPRDRFPFEHQWCLDWHVGHNGPFCWSAASPVVDNPALQYNQLVNPQRGVNMDGTALLLPLKPPHYQPRILVAGGTSNGAAWSASEAGALQTAEWIDLSATAPAWQALPNMNVARDKVNSVLLPDGRVLIVGGFETPPDGGPAEIFDPQDPDRGSCSART